jgi:hypothetical protein
MTLELVTDDHESRLTPGIFLDGLSLFIGGLRSQSYHDDQESNSFAEVNGLMEGADSDSI